MRIDEWVKTAKEQLAAAGIATAKLDAELIASDVLEHDRAWLLAHGDEEFPEPQQETANSLLVRRLNREPLAYIRGFKEFYGRSFFVSHDVLVPRPESEALIELAENCGLGAGDGVLDVGTGSGCLGITLKLELPKTEVTLIDVSKKALRVAQNNAQALGAQLHIRTQDVFDFTTKTHLPGQPFKLIVANLPYVDEVWQRSPETEHEPSLALFSPAKGLWHSMNLLSAAHYLLKKDGFILLETDPRQHKELEQYAAKLGFELAAHDGFAMLFSRAPIDYSATQPGAPSGQVDHFHA